jgi:hypothetical protein
VNKGFRTRCEFNCVKTVQNNKKKRVYFYVTMDFVQKMFIYDLQNLLRNTVL